MKPKRPAGPRLGELLETRGRLKRDVLIDVLRHQRASGGRVGTCLVELEKITEDDLLHVLSDQLKVPFTPPEDLRELTEETIKLIPEKIARQRFSVPLKSSSTHITVAMRDPTDLIALDELAFVTGKRIRPQVASEIRILEALSRYYGVELASRFVNLLDRLNRERFFWTRDGQESAEASALVELPALVVPARAPEPRMPPAPPLAPPAAAPPLRPSANSLAPIVSVYDSAVAAPPAPGPGAVASPSAARTPLAPAIVPANVPAAAAPPAAPTVPTPTPPAPATPAPLVPEPPPGPLALEAAELRLRDPGGRDEIGELLLEFVRGRAAAALLLVVRRDEAAGWLGFGPGLDDESVEACKVDLRAASFVRALRDGAAVHRGALAEMPAHAEIRALLGTNWATDLIALPLRVRERLVSVLVVTLEEGIFPPGTVDELTRLVAKASVALEMLVLRQKLSG